MSADHPLPLAPRDLLILAALAEGPAHGYGLIKAVEARSESGVLLDPANLYRVLRRMRREGWIREEPGETADVSIDPTTGVSGGAAHASGGSDGLRESRRRTYSITPLGRGLLASELARLERLLKQAKPALARNGGG